MLLKRAHSASQARQGLALPQVECECFLILIQATQHALPKLPAETNRPWLYNQVAGARVCGASRDRRHKQKGGNRYKLTSKIWIIPT